MSRPVDEVFPSHGILRRSGLCPACGEAVDESELMDEVSRAEFRITGLCAGCQTRVCQELARLEEER